MLKRTFYTLIIAVLLALISIGGYFYAVIYVGGMGSDLSLMYKKSNDLNKEEESLNSIKRVAQNADQKNAELTKYMVPVEDEGSINFVKTIEDVADSFGLKSNTTAIQIIPDEGLSKVNKEYLSVKETVVGSENMISNFVKKIELLPFNTKIKSYSLFKVGGVQNIPNKGSVATSSTSGLRQLDLEILVIKEK